MKHTMKIDGKKLQVDNNFDLVFDEEVYRVIDMETVIIVLTCPTDDYATANRIYGVKDGKIVWRVQDVVEFNADYAPFAPFYYTFIKVCPQNENLIIGGTFQSFNFFIDPQTGKIVGEESWVK